MGELLSYSTLSGLVMLALYLAYRIFIARENQHNFNRSLLLAIYIVSFSTPLFMTVFQNSSINSLSDKTVGEEMEVVFNNIQHAPKPIWGTILIWIYLTGMIIVIVKTICVWWKLIKIIRSGERSGYEGYTLVLTDDDRTSPFSWMHYLVVNQTDYANNFTTIATHELKHIRSQHWIDLLLAQIACVVNWFNPATWLMRDELMLIHEYQADMAVIENGHNAGEYQMLLIEKAVGTRFPSLANSLNHSKLKKRITMMYKSKSGVGSKLKALALVPTFALALGVAFMPSVHAAVSAIGASTVIVDKGNEKQSQDKTGVKVFKVTSMNNNGKETVVVISAEGLGDKVTVEDAKFTNGGKTYQAKSLNFDLSNGTAIITAVFPFSEELKKPSMSLNVNGMEVPINLVTFRHRNPEKAIEVSEEIEIYFDGKKISQKEMTELPKEKIASISIDKINNKIIITSKK